MQNIIGYVGVLIVAAGGMSSSLSAGPSWPQPQSCEAMPPCRAQQLTAASVSFESNAHIVYSNCCLNATLPPGDRSISIFFSAPALGETSDEVRNVSVVFNHVVVENLTVPLFLFVGVGGRHLSMRNVSVVFSETYFVNSASHSVVNFEYVTSLQQVNCSFVLSLVANVSYVISVAATLHIEAHYTISRCRAQNVTTLIRFAGLGPAKMNNTEAVVTDSIVNTTIAVISIEGVLVLEACRLSTINNEMSVSVSRRADLDHIAVLDMSRCTALAATGLVVAIIHNRILLCCHSEARLWYIAARGVAHSELCVVDNSVSTCDVAVPLIREVYLLDTRFTSSAAAQVRNLSLIFAENAIALRSSFTMQLISFEVVLMARVSVIVRDNHILLNTGQHLDALYFEGPCVELFVSIVGDSMTIYGLTQLSVVSFVVAGGGDPSLATGFQVTGYTLLFRHVNLTISAVGMVHGHQGRGVFAFYPQHGTRNGLVDFSHTTLLGKMQAGNNIKTSPTNLSTIGGGFINHRHTMENVTVVVANSTAAFIYEGGFVDPLVSQFPICTFQSAIVAIGLSLLTSRNVAVVLSNVSMHHALSPDIDNGRVMRLVMEYVALASCSSLTNDNVSITIVNSTLVRRTTLGPAIQLAGGGRIVGIIAFANPIAFIAVAVGFGGEAGSTTSERTRLLVVDTVMFAGDKLVNRNDDALVCIDGNHTQMNVTLVRCTSAYRSPRSEQKDDPPIRSILMAVSRNSQLMSSLIVVQECSTARYLFASLVATSSATSINLYNSEIVVSFSEFDVIGTFAPSLVNGLTGMNHTKWCLDGNRVVVTGLVVVSEPALFNATTSLQRSALASIALVGSVLLKCNAWVSAHGPQNSTLRRFNRLVTDSSVSRPLTPRSSSGCCTPWDEDSLPCVLPLVAPINTIAPIGYYRDATATVVVKEPRPSTPVSTLTLLSMSAVMVGAMSAFTGAVAIASFFQVSLLAKRLASTDGNSCEYSVTLLDSPTMLFICPSTHHTENDDVMPCLALGAIVGNAILCVACGTGILAASLALVLHRRHQKKRQHNQKRQQYESKLRLKPITETRSGVVSSYRWIISAAVDRASLPGALLTPYSFVLQPIAAAHVYLFIDLAPGASAAVLAATLALTVVGPVVSTIRASVGQLPCNVIQCSLPAQRSVRGWWMRLTAPQSVWVAARSRKHHGRRYLQRYGALFEMYRESTTWFTAADVGVSLLCGALSGSAHTLGCRVAWRILLGGVSSVFVLSAIVRPYAVVLDNAWYSFMSLVTVITAILIEVGASEAADALSTVQTALVLLQILCGWLLALKHKRKEGRYLPILDLARSALMWWLASLSTASTSGFLFPIKHRSKDNKEKALGIETAAHQLKLQQVVFSESGQQAQALASLVYMAAQSRARQ